MAAHSWRLIPVGSTVGQEISLAGSASFTLGRAEGQDIRLSDGGVSREHAVLLFRNGSWHVRDLNSTHGTLINGQQIQPEVEVAVSEGATVAFGPCAYTLAGDSPAAATLRTITDPGHSGRVIPIDPDVGRLHGQIKQVVEVLTRLSSEPSPESVHATAIAKLKSITGYSNIAFIRQDESGGKLRALASSGDMVFGDKVNVSTQLLNQAAGSNKPYVWKKDGSRIAIQGSLAELKLEQACIAPVVHEGKRFGFIVMDNRDTKAEKVDAEVAGNLLWLVANSTAARLFALEKEQARLAMFRGGLEAIARSLEHRDEYTRGHSERVARIAEVIARQAGWSEADRELLHLSGQVHDIGKIGVPDTVLRKEGKLNDGEFALIKKHPEAGWQMLHDLVGWDREVLEGIRHHHERWGGGGYPHGLKGESIPRFARVLALADVFDALMSDRSYRPAHSIDSALAIMRDSIGSHFDPVLAEVFFSIPVSMLEDLAQGGRLSWKSPESDAATQ